MWKRRQQARNPVAKRRKLNPAARDAAPATRGVQGGDSDLIAKTNVSSAIFINSTQMTQLGRSVGLIISIVSILCGKQFADSIRAQERATMQEYQKEDHFVLSKRGIYDEPIRSERQLVRRLRKVWSQLEPELLKNLAHDLSARLNEVIEKKRGAIAR